MKQFRTARRAPRHVTWDKHQTLKTKHQRPETGSRRFDFAPL
jgi:hypothetical protein